MTEEREPRTHRRRRRRGAGPVPGPDAAPGATPPDPAADRPRRQPRGQSAPRDPGERGLRDIVGAGRSQLGISGALRGRDVNRPTEDDLAEAEERVVIVRRHWAPPSSK
jgi:hypothetical protein